MRRADLADAVKRSVTATQVATAIGLNPDRAGFCKCPLHGEKTGSMKLYPGDRGWYCFGCHHGGSVIDLVMAYYGMDMMSAIEFLNGEFGLGLPIGQAGSQEQEEEARRRAEERKAEQARREEAEKARYEAFLQWCDLGKEVGEMELDRREYVPKTPDEEWDPWFIYALTYLAEKREQAEELAMEWCGKEG